MDGSGEAGNGWEVVVGDTVKSQSLLIAVSAWCLSLRQTTVLFRLVKTGMQPEFTFSI